MIQSINRSNIFDLIYRQGDLTRQDIVSALQLCLPTVSQNITQLISEGLVHESGSIGNTGGRRAKTFSVVPEARVAIGLDITRDAVTTVAVDIRGQIFYCARAERPFSYTDDYFRFLGDRVELAITDSGLDRERLLGVGIGLPALVSADNQTVTYGEILQITGATCADFSRWIPYPTALYNDANAACFAETWVRKDLSTLFYIMLSNNVGGAFILDGRVYAGGLYRSSEVGHIRLHPHGTRCYCGQAGCVDAYCAVTVLSARTGGDLARFFQQLARGDAALQRVWDAYLDELSLTIVNVHALFDCAIVLGGYVGAYLEPYMPDLRSRVAALGSFSHTADFLTVCSYRTEAIAAGAALNFVGAFLSTI